MSAVSQQTALRQLPYASLGHPALLVAAAPAPRRRFDFINDNRCELVFTCQSTDVRLTKLESLGAGI